MLKSVKYKSWIIYENGQVYSTIKKFWLKGYVSSTNGYVYMHLDKNYRLHKLIANYFLPNPNGYKVIDHINRDKTNNDVSNLRWCSQSSNLRNAKSNVKVKCLDTGTVYNSMVECAEALGTTKQNVYSSLKHNSLCVGHRLKKIR